MRFTGFKDDKAGFFEQLAKNQNREWFKQNKATYEELWEAPMKLLLEEVRTTIDPIYEYCELDVAKVFRIYRDVRFSKDKSPYKTSISGTISIQSGQATMDKPVALYLDVGAVSFAAAGYYMMSPDSLAKYRAAVIDPKRGAELQSLVGKLEKRGFVLGAAETLVRVPKGFDAEHPRASLLKHKGLIARFPSLPGLGDAALSKWLVVHAKAAADLVTWIRFATA